MKTKMEMAHEMALAIQSTKLLHDMELVSDMAWKYADAMQAEADKREDKTRPEVLCRVDWSQAPDEAKYWMITPNGSADWLSDHPLIDPLKIKAWYAPSFGYTGDWKDLLRERPE